jgi:hypothetical protein
VRGGLAGCGVERESLQRVWVREQGVTATGTEVGWGG